MCRKLLQSLQKIWSLPSLDLSMRVWCFKYYSTREILIAFWIRWVGYVLYVHTYIWFRLKNCSRIMYVSTSIIDDPTYVPNHYVIISVAYLSFYYYSSQPWGIITRHQYLGKCTCRGVCTSSTYNHNRINILYTILAV